MDYEKISKNVVAVRWMGESALWTPDAFFGINEEHNQNKEVDVSVSYAASFKLHLLCSSCLRKSSKVVNVPDVEDAPTNVDDFVYSGMMNRLQFSCGSCQSMIAEVVGVDQIPVPEMLTLREGAAA